MRILAMTMLTLAIAVAIAGCAVRHEDPSVNATLKKTEDSITVTSMANFAIVSVISKSGIGGATLVRAGESWPPAITVRLKLNNLECFEMNNGYIRYNTSFGSPESVPFWRVGESDKHPGNPKEHSRLRSSALVNGLRLMFHGRLWMRTPRRSVSNG